MAAAWIAVLLCGTSAEAAQVTLAWDPNQEPDLAGYKIHIGTAGGVYASTLDVGNRTTHTVTDLQPGRAYYFAITAHNSQGEESPFSAEVTTVADDVLRFTPKDTTLNVNATNYSADPLLTTYTWPSNQVANAILMKFDLTGIPSGSVMVGATLRLALVESDAGPEPTYIVSAHKIIGKDPVIAAATGSSVDGVVAWTPNTCCHSGVPLAQADISPAYDSPAIDTTPGEKTWTVTEIVREWLANPASNFGLLLNSDASKPADRYRFFASAEHSNPDLRPVLEIAYSLSPPDVTPPLISGVTPSSITKSGVTIAWATDEESDSQVDYGATTAYGSSTAVNSAVVTSHVVTLSGLSDATPYHFRVRSRDAAGNLATSANYTFVTLDGTPPTVGITAPVSAARVSGMVTVTATAADNVGVASVQFKVDGTNVAAKDTSAPYSIGWNSTTVPNGSHTLTAVARDAAGNVRTSLAVLITVENDATPPLDSAPPSIAVTKPSEGGTATGTVAVEADASDDVGVTHVQFQLDGVPLGPALTAAPFTLSWDTTATLDGPHSLTAVARDAAGNTATAAPVRLAVVNGVIRLVPQDTFLNLDGRNYSANPELLTHTWPATQVANAVLLKFDFAALPPGAVVQDATLHLALVASDAAVEPTYTVSAHRIVGRSPVIALATGLTADGVTAWTPNACCYASVPLAQADISAPYHARAVDKTPGDKTWTITAMVQEWLTNPASNAGLLLNSDRSALSNRYRYFASMEHPDPTARPFLEIRYFVLPALDVTPPTVSITTPIPDSSVSGAVPVEASASDDVGVTHVQFQLDGVPLGPALTAAPFTLSWDTTATLDGPHTLAAVARDAAGNTATAAPVRLTVVNGVIRLVPQDTFLNLDGRNYSANPELLTHTWPATQVANAVLLKFDLAALPPGAVVQDATLHLALVASDAAVEPTYTVSAHRIVGRSPVIALATGLTADGVTAWTPNACCYASVPLAQADISAPYHTRAVDKTPGDKTWTITAMVQEWLTNPASNAGLLLNSDRFAQSNRYRYFASMEHPDPTARPFLEIRYFVPR